LETIAAASVAFTDGTAHLAVLVDGGANVHTSPSEQNMFSVYDLEERRAIQTADQKTKLSSRAGWLVIGPNLAIPGVLVVPDIPFAILSETMLEKQGFWTDNSKQGIKTVRRRDGQKAGGGQIGGYQLFTCKEEGGPGTGGLYFMKTHPDVMKQWINNEAKLSNGKRFNLWSGTREEQEKKVQADQQRKGQKPIPKQPTANKGMVRGTKPPATAPPAASPPSPILSQDDGLADRA
jgi:predicted aspartyl protease